jgi:AraC family transcriptional regulator, exoenzyme S synthesis regulatory protein ExsA
LKYEEKVLKYRDYIVFGKLSMPYFNRIPKHYMENEACFVYVNKGDISVRSQSDYIDLDNKHALLAKCLNYFFETKRENRNKKEEVIVTGVMLYPSLLEEIFEFEITDYNYSVDYNLKRIEVDRLLENFRESINILIDNPELADDMIVKTKLKEFILLLSKTQNAPSQYDFIAALFKPNDIEFKSTVQHNLYSSLSIDELASLCHLSTSSFKRKFKETFEESPGKYIVKKKVEKAATLLKSRDLRISDIAYSTGFDSLATFNRNFSSIYGKSPTEYRLD